MNVERYEEALWSLTLPKKWCADAEEECTTIYHEDGVGALQIATFQKAGEVTDEDLVDLAEPELKSGAEPTALRIGDFRGFALTLDDEEAVWRYWVVAANDCALVITYNCGIEDADKEKGVVLEILRSLRLNVAS